MSEQAPRSFSDPAACVEFARARLGNRLIVGAPLALGKPNHLLNAFYRHASGNPDVRLDIFTALSLDPPAAGRGLQRRFLEPFLERHFGDYPRLSYLADLAHDRVPDNITISEFYFQSGSWLKNAHAQRQYVSSNYTHVARDMRARGVNILVQMVAVHPARPGYFSLSSNPDVTLELVERLQGRDYLLFAQLNADLPYMEGDAEVHESLFHGVLVDHHQPLFAVPRMPVSDQDYLIGLFTSALIRDRGTLQLGIGSLGDAVAYFTTLRHSDNAQYRHILDAAGHGERIPGGMVEQWGGTSPFNEGLYAASEMFMDGFLHLYRAGVLKRRIYDHTGLQTLLNRRQLAETLPADTLDVLWEHAQLPPQLDQHSLGQLTRFGILRSGTLLDGDGIRCPDGETVVNEMGLAANRAKLARHALGAHMRDGAVLHAAFFLGSRWLYDSLNAMADEERRAFRMTRVSRVNQLYRNEPMDRAQRLNSRCINTTMKMTLLGAAVSDQLEDGQVVSGVGGQYNFVAMAHALDDSRSILMLRSYRESGGKAGSNIVWEFPHATIPRHLRDIVITEYGVADLRGSSDEETVQRLLCIADSRWQEPLRRTAVAHRKLDPRWRIPGRFRNNTPEYTRMALERFRKQRFLSDYPNGSDFSGEEILLARALAFLRDRGTGSRNKLSLLWRALGKLGRPGGDIEACIARMNLERPGSWREHLERRLLITALRSTET